jgi:catechol 2,3-dioxygenase-like lactoylglutathione lyase family enzyme
MKIVPVIRSSDLQRSLHFYTVILDFERKWPGHEDREMSNGVIDLTCCGAELQLSRHSGDGVLGSVNRVFVEDVDERYITFQTRGLNTTQRPESQFTPRQLIRRGDCGSSLCLIQTATISVSACLLDNCCKQAWPLKSHRD